MFCGLAVINGGNGLGQSLDFDQKPILYSKTQATDPVAQLIGQIESRKTTLTWDKQHGWLRSLLEALSIKPSSQLLVFSKTSLQIRKISPSNPRAIYFNDNVYVGVVPRGDLIEIAAADPQLGAVFYTLDTERPDDENTSVVLKRDNNRCMTCHATGKTQNVPGFLIRSVFPSRSGQPRFELGTTTTDVSTDFIKRFGGWYITGTHGDMRHRGNQFVDARSRVMDFAPGANQTQLPQRIKQGKYITDTSDIVAMMVLEHQAQMHNAITKASYTDRQTLSYQSVINKALQRDAGYVSDSTTRQLNSAADNVVKHLLFADEFQLTAPVVGTSSFATDFQIDRAEDSHGRSLREFDLQKRLFRYPCSYLIYSESFDALPPKMLALIYERLRSVLSGASEKGFEHLTATDRQAITAILRETKPGFKESQPQ